MGTAAAALVLLPLAEGARSVPPRLRSPLSGPARRLLPPDRERVRRAPGRAVALYQHGAGVEFLDFPQAVVLAADDDVYRRLDAAEDRSGPQDQGDPGRCCCRPTGPRWPWASTTPRTPTCGVVDLAPVTSRCHPLPEARSVVPLAWAPDGSQVAYLARDETTNPYSGHPRRWGPAGPGPRAREPPSAVPGVGAGAGGRVLPGRSTAGRGRPADASASGRRPAPRDRATRPDAGVLAGPAAWSPDGRSARRLGRGPGSRSSRWTGRGQRRRSELPLEDPDRQEFLGWTGDRRWRCFDGSGSDVDDRTCRRPNVSTAPSTRELTSIGDHGELRGAARLSSPPACWRTWRSAPPTIPTADPSPQTFRILLAIGVGLVVAGVVALVNRRAPRATAVRDRRTPSGAPDEAPG